MKLVRQVADALDAAHRAGIVHRDIKPSNVLLHPDGTPVLTDLGIAAVSSSTQLTKTDVTMGTPHYMSPEQAKGQKVDHRADLYALGIILYELLSGSVPFSGDSPLAVMHQHVYEPPSPLHLVTPGLSDATYHVVDKALQKEAKNRFTSAREMMAALDDALAAEATVLPTPRQPETPSDFETLATSVVHSVEPPEPPPPGETPSPPPRRKWWIGGLVLLALLLCGGSWFAIRAVGNLFAPTEFDPLPPPVTEAPTEVATETAVSPTTITATPETNVNGTAVRLATPPTIDGSLSDWPAAVPILSPFRVYQHESWDGSDDVTAVWRIGWDDISLYIGVIVEDDIHAQINTGNQLFKGDSISLQLDTSAIDNGETLVSPDDYQLDFSPGNFTTLPASAFRFQGTAENRMLDALGHAITIEALSTDNGYVIEAAIPWNDLNTRPEAGQVLGAALNVTDNDSVETAVQEVFYSHVSSRTFSNPTSWGTLTLAP
ncbi:MAG: hypothetical protein DWQ04_08520 [Chloroflexi bacterium]|nr:MAG: hypothetical protein DWQ04_08520 [Chloroflexota bacterium]